MFRTRVVIALAVAFGAAALTLTAGSAVASAANPPLPIPTKGALFGAFADPGDMQSPSTFSALESAAGRKLDVDRVYSDLSEAEPVAQAVWDVANGIIPLISIDATDAAGTPIPWANIASGAYDSTITAEAQGLALLHAPVLLSFDHEPVGTSNGPAAEFVAAWRHFFSIVKTYATNVSSVLILTGSDYAHSNILSQWYPGDQYVDWVGADGYNYYGCAPINPTWRDFSTIFAGLEAFAVAHSKPAVVAEWASTEDPAAPDRKAAWITQAKQTMESWPQIKAASYFDSTGPFPRCLWPLTSSPSTMEAFESLGAQPYFNPRPTPVLSPAQSAGQAPLGVTFSTTGSTGTLNPIASWSLDFGDGTSTSGSGTPPAQVSHTYGAGDFMATLSLTDSAGQTNLTTATVQTTPPTIAGESSGARSTTTVNLNGSINPNGLSADYHFAWGTTPDLGQTSPQFELGVGTSNVHVSYGLTGLTPGKTYYWTLRSTSVAGSTAGPLMTLTTRGHAPSLAQVGATIGVPSGVTLTGDVTPHFVDTTWYFEYGPTTSYGLTSPATPGNAGSGNSPVAVSTHLSGLAVATTYHFALVAVNAAATTISTDHRFRTSSPPAVGFQTATRTSTNAQLSASVNPEGLATTYQFRWGTSAALGNSTSSRSAGSGTRGVRESAVLSGLKPDTTYDWDVVATNAMGSTAGPVVSLNTRGHPPSLTQVGATLNVPTGVTLTGDVTPHFVDTKWYFEYGPTTSYGSHSPASPGEVGKGTSPVAVSTHLSGLAVATTYHYALMAVNAAGTTISTDHRFHTSNPPAVGFLSATRTSTTAQLSASVNPEGLATTYQFRWGTSAALGNSTSSRSAGSGTGRVTQSASLSGLKPDTTYDWDVVATNAAGSTISMKKTFTTPAQ